MQFSLPMRFTDAAGAPLGESAATLAIAETTARTHLNHILVSLAERCSAPSRRTKLSAADFAMGCQ
jgi:hypothetical protein